MNNSYPRLLVATEFSPNASGGGPAVVRQMLKGWPAERLFWWSCFPDADQRFGQVIAGHRVTAIPQRWYPHKRWCRAKSWLLERVWCPWAATQLRRVLHELRPDMIWVIPHGWSIPPLAAVLAESGHPFHVSMHDYMNINSARARYGAKRSDRLTSGQFSLYAKASSRDAICREMALDLNQRTGGSEIHIARMGLEADELRSLNSPAPSAGGKIRIAYAGTILVPDEFALFVTALVKIKGQLNRPLSLDFFGNHSYRTEAWFDASWMVEHGNLPGPKLSEALRGCDWGFTPMALNDEDPRYNRFSLPTKFVSYLAAGLPVISLGHPESSVVKIASRHEVGLCLMDTSAEIIAKRLLAALNAKNPKEQYRPGILKCGEQEFDAVKMRDRLHNCFRHIVPGNEPVSSPG